MVISNDLTSRRPPGCLNASISFSLIKRRHNIQVDDKLRTQSFHGSVHLSHNHHYLLVLDIHQTSPCAHQTSQPSTNKPIERTPSQVYSNTWLKPEKTLHNTNR